MEFGGFNQAHDDLMVANAVVRAIAEGNLTHDNTASQEPLNPVVMSADVREVQASSQLFYHFQQFDSERVGSGVLQRLG